MAAACARPLGAWWQTNQNNNQNQNNNNGTNTPPTALCPDELTSAPGRPVVLEGDGEDDFGITAWS